MEIWKQSRKVLLLAHIIQTLGLCASYENNSVLVLEMYDFSLTVECFWKINQTTFMQ